MTPAIIFSPVSSNNDRRQFIDTGDETVEKILACFITKGSLSKNYNISANNNPAASTKYEKTFVSKILHRCRCHR
jgi:hypothetical protein